MVPLLGHSRDIVINEAIIYALVELVVKEEGCSRAVVKADSLDRSVLNQRADLLHLFTRNKTGLQNTYAYRCVHFFASNVLYPVSNQFLHF